MWFTLLLSASADAATPAQRAKPPVNYSTGKLVQTFAVAFKQSAQPG
jgi:hypothetical protein